jgi:hypothetical protein
MADYTGFPVFSEEALRERTNRYLQEAEHERLVAQARPCRTARWSAVGALLRTWTGRTAAGGLVGPCEA